LVVAIERGTPLADVLRAQAVDVREIGKRALLEAGGRKEISMMVPASTAKYIQDRQARLSLRASRAGVECCRAEAARPPDGPETRGRAGREGAAWPGRARGRAGFSVLARHHKTTARPWSDLPTGSELGDCGGEQTADELA
jgi:hypothetical protein